VRRLRALPPRTLDRLLAAALAVFGVSEVIVVAEGSSAQRGLAVAMMLVMTGTVAFRRTAPLPALVVLFAAAIPLTLAINETETLFTPFLLVVIWAYSVGCLPEVRKALLGLAIILVGVAGVSLSFADPVVGDFIFPWGFTTATWGAARALQHRTRLSAELHEAALRAEEQREEPRPARSPTSAGGSRARCTTSSRTRCRSWSCRRAARGGSSTATPSGGRGGEADRAHGPRRAARDAPPARRPRARPTSRRRWRRSRRSPSSTRSSSGRGRPGCRRRSPSKGEPRALPAGAEAATTASCRRR
jgi:hypothetical protein